VTTVTLETVIVQKPAYASRVDSDLVFFDEQAGKYFATGTVGADIWDLISEPRSIGAVCTALMEKYEVDEVTCQSEVRSFVDELLAAGLISAQ